MMWPASDGRCTRKLTPDGVEHLIGGRNDNLTALEGREWDVVIDNPTTHPRWVRSAASLLKDAADQYIFISTISVYADNSQVGMDETNGLSAGSVTRDETRWAPRATREQRTQVHR